ncbi:uncharacterized protein BcabD6B2_02490 [Babesia caballi]|uniref:Uncharacterized protein n=1 Tax=Babesia caballi TaxID=5871 RepID=A0AAV4LLW1_BABCB|nr:hypothetical protein, conserved [Babesia caballi]
MARVDVEDHIVPLWENTALPIEESEPQKSVDVDLQYSYSLDAFIERSSITSQVTISSYEDEFERLSESEVEEPDVRGVYLHDVPTFRFQPSVLDPESHPVYIEGVPIHGGNVECVDMSPYREQFGVLEHEWFIGIDYNCPDRYDPERICSDQVLVVPFEAVGRYIFCRAHRRVEHQVIEHSNEPNTRVAFDAVQDVSSWCVAGPVSMGDEWSLQILEHLSQGVYRVNALLCYNNDLTRDISSISAPGLERGPVELHVDYDGIVITDRGANPENYRSVGRMRTLYNSRVFGGDNASATVEFADFEVEESELSDQELLFSVHKLSSKLCYVSLKFSDRWQRAFVRFIVSSFSCQKQLGREPGYWREKLESGDVSSVRTLFRQSVFL